MIFPADVDTVGKKVEFLSTNLLLARQFDDYVSGMEEILHENVHYVDPVHEFRGRALVLKMLAKYVPRVCNDKYRFELLVDRETEVVWKWTISLKIWFFGFEMKINGLVHARVENGKIIYQREYYDPMESIGVIPFVGNVYKLILKVG